MVPTLDQLKSISKVSKWTAAITSNANSVLVSLEAYGSHPEVQLDLPHRLTHFFAQLGHESGGFKYDQEIASGKAYEGRKDLGNTQPGDGERFKGRGPIQLTGRSNYARFTKWVWANIDPNAPDFTKDPTLINTDPWEGLTAIWYWTKGNPTGKSLNIYADSNDLEMITRKINGGVNGLADRIDYYVRTALVFLGYPTNQVTKFQQDNKLEDDGIAGPQTRAKLHERLAFKAAKTIKADPNINVKAAPVTQTKEVAVTPQGVDKPALDIGKVVGAVTVAGSSGMVEPVLGSFNGLVPWIQALLIIAAIAGVIWFVWGRNVMANSAKTIKADIKEKQADGLPS